jgi:hypothetical protein
VNVQPNGDNITLSIWFFLPERSEQYAQTEAALTFFSLHRYQIPLLASSQKESAAKVPAMTFQLLETLRSCTSVDEGTKQPVFPIDFSSEAEVFPDELQSYRQQRKN